MLSVSALTTVGLAALSVSVSEARPIPHSVRLYRRAEVTYPNLKQPPTQWAFEQLEPYIQYHYRYLTVGCASQHNTSFFEGCCHPRFAGKTDDDVDYQCTLSAHADTKLARELVASPKAAEEAASAASSLRVVQIASASSVSVESVGSSSAVSAETVSSAAAEVSSTVAAATKTSASASASATSSSAKPTPTVNSASIVSASLASVASEKSASKAAAADAESSADAADAASKLASKSDAASAYWASESSIWSAEAASKSADAAAEAASQSAEAAAQAASQSSEAAAEAASKSFEAAAEAASKSSEAAAEATSSAASSGGSSSGSSSADWVTGGVATFFSQNGVAGACGTVHEDSFFLVAERYDRYRSGQDCGRKVEITNQANGKTVQATIADECMGCTNENSLDLSLGAFAAIGDYETGEYDIKWRFLD